MSNSHENRGQNSRQDKENSPPTNSATSLGRRQRSLSIASDEDDALQLGPRKQAVRSKTDPLVHHGRHFGRAIQAFCKVQTLIKNGLNRTIQFELDSTAEENLSSHERREHRIYRQLLQLSPGLERRLCTGSEEDIFHVAEMVMKGSSGARSDDTKSLKGVIVDWITPKSSRLEPPLSRNVKTDRGFYHPATGQLLCPVDLDWGDAATRERLRSGQLVVAGDQWPIFLYSGYKYNSADPWEGLLRSDLLVLAFKHVFTSPSSVEKDSRATRSGNARIHGMDKVTVASLAYVATQVRFALCSKPIFSRTDTITDSERFYQTIIETLEDPEEEAEVNTLLAWWNRQIFPSYRMFGASIGSKDSVMAKIKERRRTLNALKSQASSHLNTSSG